MVNKNDSPGGGKIICASVEELLLSCLCNTTGSFQTELQNLNPAPELAVAEHHNCQGAGRQMFPCPAGCALDLSTFQNFADFTGLRSPNALTLCVFCWPHTETESEQ